MRQPPWFRKGFAGTGDMGLMTSNSQARLLQRFAKNLRTARKAAGLTQPELSRLSGHNQQFISLLERGDANPTLRTIETPAKALRREPSDLVV